MRAHDRRALKKKGVEESTTTKPQQWNIYKPPPTHTHEGHILSCQFLDLGKSLGCPSDHQPTNQLSLLLSLSSFLYRILLLQQGSLCLFSWSKMISFGLKWLTATAKERDVHKFYATVWRESLRAIASSDRRCDEQSQNVLFFFFFLLLLTVEECAYASRDVA